MSAWKCITIVSRNQLLITTEHFQDYLKEGSLNLFLRQKTSEIKKVSRQRSTEIYVDFKAFSGLKEISRNLS